MRTMRKGVMTAYELVLMLLALAFLSVGLYLLITSSNKTKSNLDKFQSCGGLVLAAIGAKQGVCLPNPDCSGKSKDGIEVTPPSGTYFQNIGEGVGDCGGAKPPYCCVALPNSQSQFTTAQINAVKTQTCTSVVENVKDSYCLNKQGTQTTGTTGSLNGQCVFSAPSGPCWKCESDNIECQRPITCKTPANGEIIKVRLPSGEHCDAKWNGKSLNTYNCQEIAAGTTDTSLKLTDQNCFGKQDGISVAVSNIPLKSRCVYNDPNRYCWVCESTQQNCK